MKHLVRSGLTCLLAVMIFAGCASQPKEGPTAIAAFSAATSETGEVIVDAMGMVNEAGIHNRALLIRNQFDDIPRTTSDPFPNLNEKQIMEESFTSIRETMEVLAAYSALLVDISGDARPEAVNEASASLATAISEFKGGTETTKRLAPAVATGVNAIGQAILERKRTSSISEATAANNDAIKKISEGLTEYVDVLTGMLDKNNKAITVLEFLYVSRPIKRPEDKSDPLQLMPLNSVQKREEIDRILKIAREGQYSTDLLTKLKRSIASMAKAHNAITAHYSEKPSGLQPVRNFVREVQRLRQFHDTLKKKLEGERQ